MLSMFQLKNGNKSLLDSFSKSLNFSRCEPPLAAWFLPAGGGSGSSRLSLTRAPLLEEVL